MHRSSAMARTTARCLMLWALCGPALTWAQSAEQRLEAARQAVVEQALRQSTRVDGVSWIDTQGRLQEFHAFHQSSQVPPLAPAPALQANEAPQDLLRQSSVQQCQRRSAPHNTYATIALQTLWPQRMPQRTRDRLLELTHQIWLGSDAQRPWRMHVAVSPWPAQSNAYERLLLAPPNTPSPWTALLSFEPVGENTADRSTLLMRLNLQRERPADVLLEQRLELTLEQRPQAWGVAEWKESAWQAIAQQMQAWAQLLDQRLACEKVEPEIVAVESGRWVLNMGRLAGLRVGDEWALVNPAQLPERSMQPGVIDQMVVGRITQVQDLRAQISLVAGNAQAPQPGWVARPLAAAQLSELSPPSIPPMRQFAQR